MQACCVQWRSLLSCHLPLGCLWNPEADPPNHNPCPTNTQRGPHCGAFGASHVDDTWCPSERSRPGSWPACLVYCLLMQGRRGGGWMLTLSCSFLHLPKFGCRLLSPEGCRGRPFGLPCTPLEDLSAPTFSRPTAQRATREKNPPPIAQGSESGCATCQPCRS